MFPAASTCIEVCSALHHGAELEVLGELGLVEGLIESLGIHGTPQPNQAQVAFHLGRYLLCWQIKPCPAQCGTTQTGVKTIPCF